MKYLADENIPIVAIERLRARGIDVVSAAETMAREADAEVLRAANQTGRIVITFDKDFAELVFRAQREVAAGVILLRIRPRSPNDVATALVDLLTSDREWQGCFSVVDSRRIRMVRLRQSERRDPYSDG